MHHTQSCSRVVGPGPAGICTVATGVLLQHATKGVGGAAQWRLRPQQGAVSWRTEVVLLGGKVLSRASCSMGLLLQVACLLQPAKVPHASSICQRCLYAAYTTDLFHCLLCNPPADLAGSNKVVLPNNVETMQSSAITVLSLEEGDVHQVCSLEVGAG